jgi:hypothetical protein
MKGWIIKLRPVMAYSVPKNKMDTVARIMLIRNPHLESV